MKSIKLKKLWLKSMFLLGVLPIGAVASPTDSESRPSCENQPPAAVAENVCYSYLGVAVDTMEDAVRRENPKPGIHVIYVLENSPAARAGVLKGDVLISVDGQKLFFPNQFCSLIRSYKPGSQIKISLLRGDQTVELDATVGERHIAVSPARTNSLRKLARDDVRVYINGKEISLADGKGFEHIVLTPNGILIRDKDGENSSEVKRLMSRIHAQFPDSRQMLSSLRKRYEEALNAVVGKTQHTFSQVFFGDGNTVIIVGNEEGRRITVSRASDDNVLFRGNCTTQADIDAIPKDAKEIIDSFTVLKPVAEEKKSDSGKKVPASVPVKKDLPGV